MLELLLPSSGKKKELLFEEIIPNGVNNRRRANPLLSAITHTDGSEYLFMHGGLYTNDSTASLGRVRINIAPKTFFAISGQAYEGYLGAHFMDPARNLYTFGGTGGSNDKTQILKVDPLTSNNFVSVGTFPIRLYGHKCVFNATFAYTFGGVNGGLTNNLYRTNIATLQSELLTLSSPIPARYNHAMAISGNSVFIFGGWGDADAVLKDCYRVNLTTLEVTRLPDLPNGVTGGIYGIIDGKILVGAGYQEIGGVRQTSNLLYIYSIGSNTWETISNNVAGPMYRQGVSSVSLNGAIYTYGGDQNTTKFSDVWKITF